MDIKPVGYDGREGRNLVEKSYSLNSGEGVWEQFPSTQYKDIDEPGQE